MFSGSVRVTDADDLDAEWLLHAAAMPHYGDGRATAESIRAATRNSLARADELDCESLVLPALGCGVAGFDLPEGARLICEKLVAYEPVALADVRLIGYSDSEVEIIREAAVETYSIANGLSVRFHSHPGSRV
jgi:O-acetyl-ADP-ribose deacetylase (regulator of RNase III)